MEILWGGIAGALGSLGFFGGIALLVWAGNKGEAEKKKLQHERELKQREMEHTERLKALELGQTLPDAEVAQAPEPTRVTAGCMTFEPIARSAWHTHLLGQTLIVTSGNGMRKSAKIRSYRGMIWSPRKQVMTVMKNSSPIG